MQRRLMIVLAASALLSSSVSAQVEPPENLFKKGLALLEQGQRTEALAMFERTRDEGGQSPNLFWNLGILYAEKAQHAKAVETWQRYQKLAPQDWQGYPKLIQAYQASGMISERDAERDKLSRLWKDNALPGLSDQKSYCRDQFSVGAQRVMAYEVFAPTGPLNISLAFLVADEAGREIGFYSLRSDELANGIERELGGLKAGETSYQLTYRDPKSIRTLKVINGSKPGYDEVRALVVRFMQGDAR